MRVLRRKVFGVSRLLSGPLSVSQDESGRSCVPSSHGPVVPGLVVPWFCGPVVISRQPSILQFQHALHSPRQVEGVGNDD